MTVVLKFVVKCEVLSIDESFQGACFGHAFSKACQYDTIDKNICRNFKFISNQICLVRFTKMYNLA